MLLTDVAAQGGLLDLADRLSEIALRPQVLAPQVLPQIRELLADHPARAALEQMEHLRETALRLNLDQQVDVVGLDVQLVDPSVVEVTGFSQQIPQALGERAGEDAPTILWHPDQ